MKKTFATLAIAFLLFFVNMNVYSTWYSDYEAQAKEDYIVLERTGGLEDGKRLVPEGAMLGPNDVDSLDYTYYVLADKDLDLKPDLVNIAIHHEDTSYDNALGIVSYESTVASMDEHNEAYQLLEVEVSVSLQIPDCSDASYVLRGAKNLTFDFEMLPAD